MNLIVDTNIVFYLLAGNKKIESLLNETTVHIPFIVEIELLSHPSIAQKELELIRSFIKDSIQIPYSDSLKELVIKIRRESKVKIPDAFIAASSLMTDFPLITADSDFKSINNLNLLEFELD
ncbi:MAG: type II toxin-antitoxin system VapC family toxin [Balneola sp.]